MIVNAIGDELKDDQNEGLAALVTAAHVNVGFAVGDASSVCSMSAEEIIDILDRDNNRVAGSAPFKSSECLRFLPHQDQRDGFRILWVPDNWLKLASQSSSGSE